MMVSDRYKKIWLAGSKGFYQYHNKKWIKLFEPDEDWVVNEIFSDKKGNLWIATESNGIYEFSNNNWENISIENGLPDNNVSAIFEDKNGNKWFVTKKGIAKTNFPSE
jgi:ligand-binding sensor domain-containing protein